MAVRLTLFCSIRLVVNAMFNEDQLALMANIVQIFNYIENSQQTSNDRIMIELQKQNEVYLEEILKRLERLENGTSNIKH